MHNNMLLTLNNDLNFITYKNSIENFSNVYFKSITEGVKFLYFTFIDIVSFNRKVSNKIFLSLQAPGLLPVDLAQIFQTTAPNLDKKNIFLTSTKLLKESNMFIPESFDIKFYIKLYNMLSLNIFIIYFPMIIVSIWAGFFIVLSFISQKRARIVVLLLMSFTTLIFLLIGVLIHNTNYDLQSKIFIVFENNIYMENPVKTSQLPSFFLIKDSKVNNDINFSWFLTYNSENLNYKHFNTLESPLLYKKTQMNSLVFYTNQNSTLFWYDTKNKFKLNFFSDYATSLWTNHSINKMVFNTSKKLHSSIINYNFIVQTEPIIDNNLNKKIVSIIDHKIDENHIKYHTALLKLIYLIKVNSNFFNAECFIIIISTAVCTVFITLITNSLSLESSNKHRIKHFQEFKNKIFEKNKNQFIRSFLKKHILKFKGGPGLIEYTSLEKGYFKKNINVFGTIKAFQNSIYNRVSTTIVWVSIILGLMATPINHPSVRIFAVLTMLIFILLRLNLLKFKETYILIKNHLNSYILNKNNLIWLVSAISILISFYFLMISYSIIIALQFLYFLVFTLVATYFLYFLYLNIKFNCGVFFSTFICISTTTLLCLQFDNNIAYLTTMPQIPFNLKYSAVITIWMWSFLRLWRLCVYLKQNEFFLYWSVVILPVNFLVSAVLIQHFTINWTDLIFLLLYIYESICLVLHIFKYLCKNNTNSQRFKKINKELQSIASIRSCVYIFTAAIYVILAFTISTFKGASFLLISSILLLVILSTLAIIYTITPITNSIRTGNLSQLIGALQNFRFLKNLFNFYLISNIIVLFLFLFLAYGITIII